MTCAALVIWMWWTALEQGGRGRRAHRRVVPEAGVAVLRFEEEEREEEEGWGPETRAVAGSSGGGGRVDREEELSPAEALDRLSRMLEEWGQW